MEYGDIAAWERTGGTKSLNSLVALLYDLGGKTLVAGFFLFIAGVFFFVAYITLSLKRRRRARS